MCTASSFRIKRFFCCFPLKIGSLIIGYLGLIGHVFYTAIAATNYESLRSEMEYSLYAQEDSNCTSRFTYYFIRISSQYLAAALAYNVVSIIFYLSLLWGIHKGKSEFFLPWLITKAFEYIAILSTMLTYLGFGVSGGLYFGYIFLLIGIFSFSLWLMIYSYMCVYSQYFELKTMSNAENETKNLPPTYSYISSILDEKKHSNIDTKINQEPV